MSATACIGGWFPAAIPDKLTSGVAKASKRSWRYWTRLNGATTWGPHRFSVAEADADRVAALAGNPPPLAKRSKMSAAERLMRGFCHRCDLPAEAGKIKCAAHLKEDCEIHELRRRKRGIQSRAAFLAKPRPKRKRRRFTKDAIDAKLILVGRCQCGLLLPCYADHDVIAYATAGRD